MKITDRCLNTRKTFEELQVGTVFRDADGDIMMKIRPAKLDDETDCIRFSDGEGFTFSNHNIVVIPIPKVELVIG